MFDQSGTTTTPTAGTASAQKPPPGRQRNSRQAAAIEDALTRAGGFSSAQELFTAISAAGDRVGLTTVYRHLTLLAQTDRADVLQSAEGEALYRLCGPHTETHHHHHLVCRVCGHTVEIAAPHIETWIDGVASEAGYTDVTHTVELFGLCPQHSA